jgi:hypothetical protein
MASIERQVINCKVSSAPTISRTSLCRNQPQIAANIAFASGVYGTVSISTEAARPIAAGIQPQPEVEGKGERAKAAGRACWLVPHAVKDRPSHTAQAIRERAVVVFDVLEVKGRENDQQSHEDSHLTSDLKRASQSARLP